jgi:hypothetical protein
MKRGDWVTNNEFQITKLNTYYTTTSSDDIKGSVGNITRMTITYT